MTTIGTPNRQKAFRNSGNDDGGRPRVSLIGNVTGRCVMVACGIFGPLTNDDTGNQSGDDGSEHSEQTIPPQVVTRL